MPLCGIHYGTNVGTYIFKDWRPFTLWTHHFDMFLAHGLLFLGTSNF